ncbi:helicase C-terminal domain-containing protein, partial [Ochromonadaceae sp. CCMP2298]
ANGGSGGSGGRGGNGGRGEPVAFHSIVTEFEAAVRTYGGCALMAVCRGKVSEGIDFADSKGRVVIITGIPFAPFMDPWVMLKKQHLDDKGKRADPAQAIDAAVSAAAYLGVGAAAAMAIDKSRGANAAVAGVVVHPGAFGRTIAPSAHAGVLARGAAGGFVSAAAMLASSNDAPPAPAPASAPGTSLYPAAYLAGQSSNYTNTNSNNSSSYPSYTAPAAPSLTGQAWYTQGALRAVNQAIGRVIRHNKDWGTVLLMDDRFMNDRQLSQLSSWVRPRVKKFTSFVTAMSSFRSFITAAALDKELAPRVRPDDQPPRILNRAYKPQVAPTNTFARHVEISADGIEQESTFIDPSLLATQPDGRSAGGGGRMEGDSEQALLSLFQRNRSEGEGGQGGYAEADVLSVYDVDGDEEGGTASSMYDAFSRSRAKSAPPAPPAPPTNSLNSLNSGYSVNSGSRDSSGDGGGPSAARSAQWPPSRDEYPAALERRALSTSTSASASASATTSAGVLRGQGQGGQGSMPAPTRTMTAPKVSSFGIGNKTSFAEMGIAKAKQAGQAEKVSGKESGLFNIFNPRSQPQPQPSASTQPAKPSLSLSQISQQASQRQGRVGGAGVREVNDAMLEFNEQVANLRELVDGPSLKVVKDALRMAKHVKTLSQMKPLAERLILLLQSVEREAAFHALASFAAVLPPDVAGGYLDMVNSAIDVQALLAEREREWEEQRGRKRAR